jgi:hypothetical protein
MVWNLTDPLSTASQRAFHLPLASDPQGGANRPVVAASAYTVREVEIERVRCLEVKVTEPSGGFPAEGTMAAAVVRLHAMGSGRLGYAPQLGELARCLVLDLWPIWMRARPTVRWIDRWIEADCIPRTIILENVDPDQLRQRLAELPVPPESQHLFFPVPVLAGRLSKDDFIDRFLAGEPGQTMTVKPGAYLGRMGADPSVPNGRMLRLHARYQGHSEATPRPMAARELLNLLFGIDSPEFSSHPLLRAIQQAGESDTTTQPVSRRLLLRPPLRTHARVLWEAVRELPDASVWSQAGSLDDTKLLNSLEEFDRTKHYGLGTPGAAGGVYKCNLLGFEMLLRSGFRVRMVRYRHAGQIYLYYRRVNPLVEEARKTQMTRTEPGYLAREGEAIWGRRWDGVLISQPEGQHAQAINRMMEEEGRAFYLVREFAAPADDRAGHFALLDHVETSFPDGDALAGRPTVWWEIEGDPGVGSETKTTSGLAWIRATVYEAVPGGLRRHTYRISPAWPGLVNEADESLASRNNDLLLIEAHPGQDPDTIEGIRNLCSIRNNVPSDDG